MVTSHGMVWMAFDKKPKLFVWEAGLRQKVFLDPHALSRFTLSGARCAEKCGSASAHR